MKKISISLLALTCLALSLTAGGKKELRSKEADQTRIYASEQGDIKVPAHPKRVVVLNAFVAGSVFKFYGPVVGHEKWTAVNPLFADYLKDSTEVDPENVEQVMALNPDLIITTGTNKHIKELSQIAPTIPMTYGKFNYLETVEEAAKIFGKEAEAEKWKKNFAEKVEAAGEEIKKKYGKDVSVSVMEAFGDNIYLYGDNWGRGTQLVYQQMGLKMPQAVKDVAMKDGYYAISAEVVPKYSADLMIFSKFKGADTSFLKTKTYQNIPAVKKNRVLVVDAESFYMTDPITMENQLKIIKDFFLKN